MTGVVHRIAGAFHDEQDGADYRLGTQWWFNADDPAAVLLRCPQPHGAVRDWLFARSLLAHGLRGAAGCEVFHIEPCESGEHVMVTAFFDEGLVTVKFGLVPVEAFLVATTEFCPTGEIAEGRVYAEKITRGLDELLNEWPR